VQLGDVRQLERVGEPRLDRRRLVEHGRALGVRERGDEARRGDPLRQAAARQPLEVRQLRRGERLEQPARVDRAAPVAVAVAGVSPL
jgi:hypothetical protein